MCDTKMYWRKRPRKRGVESEKVFYKLLVENTTTNRLLERIIDGETDFVAGRTS